MPSFGDLRSFGYPAPFGAPEISVGTIVINEDNDITSLSYVVTHMFANLNDVEGDDTSDFRGVVGSNGPINTCNINTVDVNKYTSLITSEHIDKTNFYNTVAMCCQPLVDIQNLLQTYRCAYNLDMAVGTQLDVLGQWIGATRYLKVPITGVFFSFDTAGVGWDQGVWEGPFNPTTQLLALPDDHYRLLLRSTIMNNQWDGSNQQSWAIANTVFNPLGYSVIVKDNADLSMSLGLFGTTASPTPLALAMLTQGILDIKPATVKISNYFYTTSTAPIFAFDVSSGFFGGWDIGAWATMSITP